MATIPCLKTWVSSKQITRQQCFFAHCDNFQHPLKPLTFYNIMLELDKLWAQPWHNYKLRKGLNLDHLQTLQHIYIYISIYTHTPQNIGKVQFSATPSPPSLHQLLTDIRFEVCTAVILNKSCTSPYAGSTDYTQFVRLSETMRNGVAFAEDDVALACMQVWLADQEYHSCPKRNLFRKA